jgi:hypothetical protein
MAEHVKRIQKKHENMQHYLGQNIQSEVTLAVARKI